MGKNSSAEGRNWKGESFLYFWCQSRMWIHLRSSFFRLSEFCRFWNDKKEAEANRSNFSLIPPKFRTFPARSMGATVSEEKNTNKQEKSCTKIFFSLGLGIYDHRSADVGFSLCDGSLQVYRERTRFTFISRPRSGHKDCCRALPLPLPKDYAPPPNWLWFAVLLGNVHLFHEAQQFTVQPGQESCVHVHVCVLKRKWKNWTFAGVLFISWQLLDSLLVCQQGSSICNFHRCLSDTQEATRTSRCQDGTIFCKRVVAVPCSSAPTSLALFNSKATNRKKFILFEDNCLFFHKERESKECTVNTSTIQL